MAFSKRKISLVTKTNFEEHQIIMQAFDASNYNTLGSFIRDSLINSLKAETSFSVPTVTTETAEEMATNTKLLNQLIEHLNSALVDENLFSSYQDKERYLIDAIELAYYTANALKVWSHFLKQNFDESIKEIAFSTLTARELSLLASEKSLSDEEAK